MKIKKFISYIIVFAILLSNITVYANNDDKITSIEVDESLKIQEEMLEEEKTDNYIIKYKDKEKSQKKLLKIRGRGVVKQSRKINSESEDLNNMEVVKLQKELTIEEAESLLGGDDIEYIQPDYELHMEEIEVDSEEESIENKDIKIESSNNSIDLSFSNDIIVAVIDSKIDVENEKLNESIWINTDETMNGLDTDGNGYIDDINGYDFVDISKDYITKEEYHGTHVAGIITGNSSPNKVTEQNKIKIMPLTVFKDGSAKTSDIIEAIEYAKNNGAKIINASFGTREKNPALEEAIQNAPDILFVCAAGNYRKNLDEKPVYPAALGLSNVMSVASVNDDGGLSYYSNYGNNKVDIAAPGKNIVSLAPENKTEEKSGTSMSAAAVTRSAAVIMGAKSLDNPKEIKEKLIESADKISSLDGYVKKAARLNIENALADVTKSKIENIEFIDEFSTSSEIEEKTEGIKLFAESKTIKVEAGWHHSLALKEDGTVWAWGKGDDGQLGNGKFEESTIPVQVKGLTDIKNISIGGYHNFAVDNKNRVWTWGDNSFGQLGIGSTESSSVPLQVNTGSDISAGYFHSISNEFTRVYGFGCNNNGELGTPEYGNYVTTPKMIKGLTHTDETNVYFVGAGYNRTYAIRDAVGYPRYQYDVLGFGSKISNEIKVIGGADNNVSSLSVGKTHMAITLNEGNIIMSGSNEYGELGSKDRIERDNKTITVRPVENIKSVECGSNFTLALTNDGNVYRWGKAFNNKSNIQNIDPVKINIKNIKQISAGDGYALMLDNSGQIWGLGQNYEGQLGTGNTTFAESPVKVLDFKFEEQQTSKSISAGAGHSLTIKSDGTVWAWGDNTYGQLGDGTNSSSNTPVQVQGLTNAIEVKAGKYFSLALKSDGTAWAWGRNNRGQLGNGSNSDSNIPVKISSKEPVKSLSAGFEHGMLVDVNKDLWCWGANDKGQLGDRTYNDSNLPVKNSLTTISDVSAGAYHSIVLKKDGDAYTFGDNAYCQLGKGNNPNSYNEFENSNKAIYAGSNIRQISAGAYHSMLLTNSGYVEVCGKNENGELFSDIKNNINYFRIVSVLTNEIKSIEAGTDTCFVITDNKELLYWGNKDIIYTVSGTPYENSNIQILDVGYINQISAGDNHQLVMRESNSAWGYGDNDFGQLGNGNYDSQSILTEVLWPGVSSLFPLEGSGTASDPYKIYDGQDLNKVRNKLAAYYELQEDIWIDDILIMPVGTEKNPFTGYINGNGYFIYELHISLPNIDNVGLFGYTKNAVIENLGLVKADIRGRNNVGALIGTMVGGIVRNCSSKMSVKVENMYGSSGLVGYSDNFNNIINSTFDDTKWGAEGFNKNISIKKGEQYRFMLTVSNVPAVKKAVYKITYDSSKIEPLFIGTECESGNGSYIKTDPDIVIISNSNGVIKFRVERDSRNWSGILTEIGLKAKTDGTAEIKFEIE